MPSRHVWRLLFTLGSAHALADAMSGFAAGSLLQRLPFGQAAMVIALYNLVAFGLQPLFGWLVDRGDRRSQATVFGFAMIGVGSLLFSVSFIASFLCLAIGSALFHVGAGAWASLLTPQKAIGAAVFTAPGVIGLTLGTIAGLLSLPIAPLLFVGTLLGTIGLSRQATTELSMPISAGIKRQAIPLLFIWMFLLVVGTATRSFTWTAVSGLHFGWKPLLALGIAAGIGKLLGGVSADRLGRSATIGISVLLAGAFLLLRTELTLVLGVAFLQASTPIVLATLVQRLPRYGSLVTGCVLGLGIFLGGVAYHALRAQTMGGNGSLLISVLLTGGFLAGAGWLQKDPYEMKNSP